jgi:intracellular sulfur oxidation DsrE/DsrF family protein
MQDDVGTANAGIAIVAHGPGIGMPRLESPTSARMADVVKAKVRGVACETPCVARGSPKRHGARHQLRAGRVTEIMKKQGEGRVGLQPRFFLEPRALRFYNQPTRV